MQAAGLSDRLLKEEYLRRLQEEGLRYYKPHAAQVDFHQSQNIVRLLLGSNQCGKSYALRAEIAWAVGKIHPYRENYIGHVFARHCCADFQVMSSVVIPGYKALLPRKPCVINGLQWPGLRGGSWDSAWSAEARTIFFADDSLIEFKSYDQDILSYAGPPRHIVGHDEEPPQKLREENVARQATTGRNELFAFTPLNYSQWIYTLIEQGADPNANVGVFRMSMYDNPHIARETIRAIEESISDPAERAARVYGEPTFVEGRVWKEYGEHNLIDPFPVPQHWHRTVIVDPHPEKATGVNAIATDEQTGRSYVYWEADIKGDVEFICNQIKASLSGQFVQVWLIDPSSRQRAGIYGKGSLVDEFRKFIPYFIEANNDVDVGREAVRDLEKNNPTGGPRLKVFKSCPTTDFQLRNYSWKPPTASGENRKHPEVVKRNDEHPDCIRYFAMHNRQNFGGEQFAGFKIGLYGTN